MHSIPLAVRSCFFTQGSAPRHVPVLRCTIMLITAVVLGMLGVPRARAQCAEQWFPDGGGIGVTNGREWTMAWWDSDGPGPQTGKLVVGGNFSAAGSIVVNNIATFDIETGQWGAIGAGLTGDVEKLAALPDGTLVAASRVNTLSTLSRWDGALWTAIATTVDGITTRNGFGALCPLPSGDLVVGGTFTSLAGVTAANIARWDGANWHAMGAGLNARVNTIALTPTGDPMAGGEFTGTGGPGTFGYVARWNGTAWTSDGLPGHVHARAFSRGAPVRRCCRRRSSSRLRSVQRGRGRTPPGRRHVDQHWLWITERLDQHDPPTRWGGVHRRGSARILRHFWGPTRVRLRPLEWFVLVEHGRRGIDRTHLLHRCPPQRRVCLRGFLRHAALGRLRMVGTCTRGHGRIGVHRRRAPDGWVRGGRFFHPHRRHQRRQHRDLRWHILARHGIRRRPNREGSTGTPRRERRRRRHFPDSRRATRQPRRTVARCFLGAAGQRSQRPRLRQQRQGECPHAGLGWRHRRRGLVFHSRGCSCEQRGPLERFNLELDFHRPGQHRERPVHQAQRRDCRRWRHAAEREWCVRQQHRGLRWRAGVVGLLPGREQPSIRPHKPPGRLAPRRWPVQRGRDSAHAQPHGHVEPDDPGLVPVRHSFPPSPRPGNQRSHHARERRRPRLWPALPQLGMDAPGTGCSKLRDRPRAGPAGERRHCARRLLQHRQ